MKRSEWEHETFTQSSVTDRRNRFNVSKRGVEAAEYVFCLQLNSKLRSFMKLSSFRPEVFSRVRVEQC
ncbi:hypothetical protein VZT92_009561 [Zoarces viviparus]|uniref:Uncharacterized protein n=1 Tax=Zoarces viviparus TaxID=48416 RepID=A0AAW1FBY2_ZOAVI